MTRDVELLSSAIHGIASTAEAWKRAGVLTPNEFRAIHSAIWRIVVDAEKEQADELAARLLAQETAECL